MAQVPRLIRTFLDRAEINVATQSYWPKFAEFHVQNTTISRQTFSCRPLCSADIDAYKRLGYQFHCRFPAKMVWLVSSAAHRSR